MASESLSDSRGSRREMRMWCVPRWAGMVVAGQQELGGESHE